MEERVVIANLSSIITKDVLIDEPNKNANIVWTNSFPLLAVNDDDEDEIFMLMQLKSAAAAAKAAKSEIKSRLEKQALASAGKSASHKRNHPELNLLHRYVDADFESYLHMRKSTFLNIHKTVEQILIQKSIINGAMQYTLLSLGLWKLCTDEHFEEISRKFQIPWSLAQSIVRSFWHILSDNYEAFIKWPNSLAAQKSALQGFQQLPQLRCFSGLFGVIALRQLDIFLDCELDDVSVVLQIICNAEHKIIDCFVELAQSYSFEESPIGQTLKINMLTMPPGSYLIGNNTFPLKSYLIRPIQNEPSHTVKVKNSFNELLQPAFQLADDVMEKLARRFNTLYDLEARDMTHVRLIVESVCAMHNACIDFKDDYLEQQSNADGQHKFSWGNAAVDVGCWSTKDSENDVNGLRRRTELLNTLLKQPNP